MRSIIAETFPTLIALTGNHVPRTFTRPEKPVWQLDNVNAIITYSRVNRIGLPEEM